MPSPNWVLLAPPFFTLFLLLVVTTTTFAMGSHIVLADFELWDHRKVPGFMFSYVLIFAFVDLFLRSFLIWTVNSSTLYLLFTDILLVLLEPSVMRTYIGTSYLSIQMLLNLFCCLWTPSHFLLLSLWFFPSIEIWTFRSPEVCLCNQPT